MAQYTFDGRLAYTRGVREATDIETIKAMLPGCRNVVKTEIAQDKTGIDYVATLRHGGQVCIDAKTRVAGASRWWKKEPELALETWSVMPDGKYSTPYGISKIGWTLSERTEVDLILYTFDQKDSDVAYLLSFQMLRTAFVHNRKEWAARYKVGKQDSFRWESEAIFVPASIVLQAIMDASCGIVVRME